MVWSQIKKWAKDQGYKAERTKIEGENKKYIYDWVQVSNPNNKDRAESTFALAKSIYNHMTDYKHVEYQKAYTSELNVYVENPLKYQ